MSAGLDYSRGYTKVPRALLEKTKGKPYTLALALHLLARTCWKPTTVLGSQGVIDLEVGEAVFGREKSARECGFTVSQTRTAQDHLEKLGLFAFRSTSRGTISTALGFKETYGVAFDASNESHAESPAVHTHDSQPVSHEDRSEDARSTATLKTQDQTRQDQTLRDQTRERAGSQIQKSGIPPGWRPRVADTLLEGENLELAIERFAKKAGKGVLYRSTDDDWSSEWREFQNTEANDLFPSVERMEEIFRNARTAGKSATVPSPRKPTALTASLGDARKGQRAA